MLWQPKLVGITCKCVIENRFAESQLLKVCDQIRRIYQGMSLVISTEWQDNEYIARVVDKKTNDEMLYIAQDNFCLEIRFVFNDTLFSVDEKELLASINILKDHFDNERGLLLTSVTYKFPYVVHYGRYNLMFMALAYAIAAQERGGEIHVTHNIRHSAREFIISNDSEGMIRRCILADSSCIYMTFNYNRNNFEDAIYQIEKYRDMLGDVHRYAQALGVFVDNIFELHAMRKETDHDN